MVQGVTEMENSLRTSIKLQLKKKKKDDGSENKRDPYMK